MKISGRIAVVGVGLLIASSGVLYPLQGKIASAGSEVDGLRSQLQAAGGVHVELLAARAEMEQARARAAGRDVSLCPATPEAQHAFESDLAAEIERSGLHSIRTDRRPETRDGRPILLIDMVVEGEATSLHKFLVQLEGMRWVTRVLSLGVEPGSELRRITLQIAVMLEQKP